ncbi:SanA/YdcF family protein [Flavobacterium davisii]|uniref:YdcF family protein n=1 Tax=Flavobacterium columnare TaxID=996 RepID=A0A8G0KT10_9FLAO|nr:ElyC/SanA/YdcF family protein [Flavobacterium davisii]QYS89588.1 YdcF family protein [Flavobacterium davisii]
MKKYFKITLYGSALFIVTIFAVNYYIKSTTEDLIYTSDTKIPTNKVGIIFGAGINGNQPSKYLKDRLDAGIQLYNKHKIEKILLSGDNGRDEYDELTVMKNYCYQNGVDTTKIYIDYAGFDTYSTLYRAKSIFKIKNAILISQKYHLNRAIYIGSQKGLDVIGYSANKGAYKGYKYVCFREYFSRFKSVMDVFRNRKPHFLGTVIPIEGVSNFSKEDKR